MSIATMGELKAAIYAWTARTDLTAVASDFVSLAESHIRKKIRTRDQLTALAKAASKNPPS